MLAAGHTAPYLPFPSLIQPLLLVSKANMDSSSLVRRGSVNSSSLTFGFAFMGILLVMLIAASLLQRHIAARERAERMRLGLALDGLTAGFYGFADGEDEVPQMCEVYVKPGDTVGKDMGREGKEVVKEGRTTQRWRWKDVQVRPQLSFVFVQHH